MVNVRHSRRGWMFPDNPLQEKTASPLMAALTDHAVKHTSYRVKNTHAVTNIEGHSKSLSEEDLLWVRQVEGKQEAYRKYQLYIHALNCRSLWWSHRAPAWMFPLISRYSQGDLFPHHAYCIKQLYIHEYDRILFEREMHVPPSANLYVSLREKTRGWVKWESAGFYFLSCSSGIRL